MRLLPLPLWLPNSFAHLLALFGVLQAFRRILSHIAPTNSSLVLRESDITRAMRMYNLERSYAMNALTISSELISLRRDRGLGMADALLLLQRRVKEMELSSAADTKPCTFGLAGNAGGGGGGAKPDSEDCHVEKRRRVAKSPSIAQMGSPSASTFSPGAASGVENARGSSSVVGNEENTLRAEKRAVSSSSVPSTSSRAVAGVDPADAADFKRARTGRTP